MTASTRQPANNGPRPFRMNQRNHVYGIVDDPDRQLSALTADLLAARFPSDRIQIASPSPDDGSSGDRPSARRFRAGIRQLLETVDGHLPRVDTELRAGHALVGVAVDEARMGEVARIMHRHSGHDVVYYGRYTWQTLGS